MDKKFQDRVRIHDKKLQEEKKKHALLGNLKLLVFILLILAIGFNGNQLTVIFVLDAILLIALIGLFILQAKISEEINYHKKIVLINEKNIKRINGDWGDFSDCGKIFLDKSHDFCYDLDIVGDRSIFQMINTTNTFLGKNKFASKLLNIKNSKEKILKNQEGTKELASDLDFCQDFEYLTSEVENQTESEGIVEILDFLSKENKFIQNKNLRGLIHFLPALTVILLGISIVFKLNNLLFVSVGLVMVQGVIWGIGFSKMGNYLAGLTHYNLAFGKYTKILKIIESKDFKSSVLKEYKAVLFEKSSSLDAISELEKITQRISFRHNFILYFILNLFLLWDFEICFSLEKWKSKYSKNIESWFDTLAEIESLISFSVLNNVLETNSYPTIVDDMKINTKHVGHPLIGNKERVYNDFLLDDQIVIVSGSNMSGKTTFLRTIGINLVLAYNGSVVCGEKFSAPVLDICTSMRIADNLGEGISTFYAELIKIKKIIDCASENRKMLFLIDEIFRGTNSKDRLFGAKTVIKDLDDKNVIGLITTHDLEICELEERDRIINHYFKENYFDDKIEFDYKLRKGISTSTNGVELMKLIGITV